MLPLQHVPSGVFVLPETLGVTVLATAEALKAGGEQASQSVLLYVEKRGGFQCRSCTYAVPQNATHGRCAIMEGTIHLDDGCCIAWTANKDLLHLYREPSV